MLTLYLVRHGETAENVKGILQGHMPGNLTMKGINEARLLSERLENMNIDTIISSDLKRAVDTAEILNLKAQMDINATPMLRERDWGKLTGCSIKDVKGMDFPSSVESVENMYARAAQFINTTYEKYDGKAVLVVSHGLFIRCIIGVASQLKIREVPRMANAEMRVLTIEKPIVAANPTEDSEASAS